jgi:hypothetical protein
MSCEILVDNKGRERVRIDDTTFKYFGGEDRDSTNFAGDPDAKGNTFHSTERKGRIIIPDPEFANLLKDRYGCNVKRSPEWVDSDGNVHEEQYYVEIKVKYGSDKRLWPRIYIVNGEGKRTLLDPDTVGEIDRYRADNVCAVLRFYNDKSHNSTTLWVETMYVEPRFALDLYLDPYKDRYHD